MIFQIGDILLAGLILDFLLWGVIFIFGFIITRRLADKKGFEDIKKPAIILNLVWFVIGLSIGIVTTFVIPEADWLSSLIGGIVNIIVGIFIVKKIYKKESGESLVFVIEIQLILLALAVILGFIFAFIIAAMIVSLSA
jgi:hypothetical protein